MKLSILICHLNSRKAQYMMCVDSIGAEDHSDVEILYEADDGQIPIGQKRNWLLERATGDYIAFIDDDDTVTSDYLPLILSALQAEPDCVGISGLLNMPGYPQMIFKHSIQYGAWYTGNDGVFYRTPNHLNPVKRQLALQARFPSSRSFGEDRIYSDMLRVMLKTEVMTCGSLGYTYIYNAKPMRQTVWTA